MKRKTFSDKSIAVLPFINMSADADKEYFSDGITTEIINALAQIDALKVTSRTSSFFFKGKNIQIKEIAQQLNVTIILEGSVRIAGDQVRIKAQLIEPKEDFHFWSETWNRKLENIFDIQDEVSVHIADKLREHLGHFEFDEHLVDKQTDNLDAYTLYLKALYHYNTWNPEDVALSIEYFEKALNLDPHHTESMVGLADAYGFMGTTESLPREEAFMKNMEYTQKARAINPNNAGVYFQLANLSFFTDSNYADAMDHINHALQLRPNYSQALQFKAFLFMLTGDLEIARRHVQLVLDIDPLNPETIFYKAYYHYRAKDYATAEKICEDILIQNPKNKPVIIVLSYCKLKQNKLDETLALIEESLSETIMPDEKLGIKCLAYILKGDKKKGQEQFELLRLEAQKPYSFQAHSYLYLALVNLNKFDEAFDWLEKALDMKSSILMLTFSDPLSERIREDKRFLKYKNRIYSNTGSGSTIAEKAPLLDEETASRYTTELITYLEQEKPYLNPTLSLRTLAELLQIHPNKLSWLLNEKLGKKFNQFINQYRLTHFKALAVDPKNSHISIIGLAYESGFNSKTVFNTFFKQEEGMTPNDYIKRLNTSN